MSPSTHNPNQPPSGSGADHAGTVDATLRLVATLPAPSGLEDRIHSALRSAHARRPGRVLAWPSAHRSSRSWMRTAAAAAIAFVIAGGGWGVYSHVQPAHPAGAMIAPAQPAAGGFSAAGAIRTPQTLNGPVVAHPAEANLAQPNIAQPLPARPRPAGKHAAAGASAKGQPVAKASAAQPAAPAAQ
jgi:hypothetical protein